MEKKLKQRKDYALIHTRSDEVYFNFGSGTFDEYETKLSDIQDFSDNVLYSKWGLTYEESQLMLQNLSLQKLHYRDISDKLSGLVAELLKLNINPNVKSQ
jgi:hypothetical protein